MTVARLSIGGIKVLVPTRRPRPTCPLAPAGRQRRPPRARPERARGRHHPAQRRRPLALQDLGTVDAPHVRPRRLGLPALWRPPAHHRHHPGPGRRAHDPRPPRPLGRCRASRPGPTRPHPDRLARPLGPALHARRCPTQAPRPLLDRAPLTGAGSRATTGLSGRATLAFPPRCPHSRVPGRGSQRRPHPGPPGRAAREPREQRLSVLCPMPRSPSHRGSPPVLAPGTEASG